MERLDGDGKNRVDLIQYGWFGPLVRVGSGRDCCEVRKAKGAIKKFFFIFFAGLIVGCLDQEDENRVDLIQ